MIENYIMSFGILTTAWLFIAILAPCFVCAAIAAEKKRTQIGWFIMGLIFNIFAVIAVCALEKKDNSKI